MNSVLLEDFNYISNSDINFENLENKVIMVTGATGLIGSLLVKSMLFCDKEHNLNLKIVALVRNKNKVNDIYNEYQGDSRLSFKYVDLLVDEIKVKEKIDYRHYYRTYYFTYYSCHYKYKKCKVEISFVFIY